MDKKNNQEVFELTSSQRFYGNLSAGALVVVCGLFLLLCGTNVINLYIGDVLIASLLYTVGLVLLATGFIQRNSVSVWLAIAFITPATVEILAHYTPMGYSNLYPLYIAIPALSSLVTFLYTLKNTTHFYVILFFAPISIIFALKSSGLLGWGVVLPMFIVFLGICIVLLAIKFKSISEKDE